MFWLYISNGFRGAFGPDYEANLALTTRAAQLVNMEKVSALLNSLDLGGQDSSSAPGVDSTILDLITNQRWFRDAVFTAGYLSDVDIGRARATASVVDRLCAPRALRVVACAGLRGLAQTEGLPAIGTAVAVYEAGGDAAAEPRPVPLVRNGVQIRCKFSLGEPS
mgnify:CR=1 FL=1